MKVLPIIIASLLLASMASADTLLRNENVEITGSAEPGTTFAFIQGQTGYDVRATFRQPTCGFPPTQTGQNCRSGEYIVALQCSSASGGSCERVFSDDYLKQSPNDNLQLSNWFQQTWFQQLLDRKPCSAYQCLAEDEAYVEPESNVAFLSFNYPRAAFTNEEITVTGRIKATRSGPFILESNIDPNTRQPFAVVSSRSVCDGSAFYSGTRINGVAGRTYDYQLTMRTPPEPGQYTIRIYTWTDCYKDGGKEIQTLTKTIEIKDRDCSLQATAVNLAKSAGPFWWQSSEEGLAGLGACTIGQLRDWCGARDTDNDNLPDGCDYCPQDAGSPDNNGCHPCFGKDPRSESGRQCYRAFEAQYGIPDVAYDSVWPVTHKEFECSQNAAVGWNVRENGDRTQIKYEACGDTECLETQDNAYCSDPEPEVTLEQTLARCQEGDVVIYEIYSDGSEKRSHTAQECQHGCEQASCLNDPEPRMGTGEDIREPENPPVSTPDAPDCSKDSDCPSGEYCDQLGQCVADQVASCTADADCPAGDTCSAELGACITTATTAECTTDDDCTNGWECTDSYCIPSTPASEDLDGSTCTEDSTWTCSDGTQITVAKCVDGEYKSLDNTCADDSAQDNPSENAQPTYPSGAPSEPPSDTSAPLFTPGESWSIGDVEIPKGPSVVVIILIAGLLGYYYYEYGRKKR